MITDSFDEKSQALINPKVKENRAKCDVIIVTFSNEIEDYVKTNFSAKQVNEFSCCNGKFPIFVFEHNGKTFGFYKSVLGAPVSVGMLEDVATMLDCKKFVVFGSAGVLDKNCYGRVIVPTYAYRDEGTSYHYTKAEDYIEIENSEIVVNFMENNNISFVKGKCWTTDAFYRETKTNFDKRRKDGCIAVDMECSAMQACANFRNLDLYYFFLSGDLLDSPEWCEKGLKEANHSHQNFDIALHLAEKI